MRDCWSWYDSKVWQSNDKYWKVVWQYNYKFDGGKKCATPHLDEETIKRLFIKALNTIGKEKNLILAGFGEVKDTAFETREVEARLEEVQAAITEKQAQWKMMENFMDVLRSLPEQEDYFDEAAWYAMMDIVIVYGKDDVRFTFKNGMEIGV